jgi:hypothetical protein
LEKEKEKQLIKENENEGNHMVVEVIDGNGNTVIEKKKELTQEEDEKSI